MIVGGLSFLLALGDGTPLGHLAHRVPVLNLFRAPGRHLFIVTLCASALAGWGFAALTGRRIRPTIAAGTAALVVALGIAWTIHPAPAALGVWVTLIHAAIALGGVALIGSHPTVGRTVIVAAVVLDLGTVAYLDSWRRSPPTPEHFRAPSTAETYGEVLRDSGQRLAAVHGPAGDSATLPPNRSALWRVPSVGGYNPLRLSRPAELMDLGPRGRQLRDRALDPPRGLDLLAVRFVSAKEGDPSTVTQLRRSDAWTFLETVDGATFFERTEATPRAWLVSATRTATDESALGAIRSGTLPDGTPFDPRTLALTEGEAEDFGPADPAATVTLLREESRRVDVRTSTTVPAFLVLSNVWYPGWSATRDGTSVPLQRVNFTLLGVPVPAGEHTTSFRFRPGSLRTGAAISLFALAGLLVALVRRRRAS